MNHLLFTIQAWVAARYQLDEEGERGATMVEYGLLVAFIALIALVGVKALGVRVDALFDTVTF